MLVSLAAPAIAQDSSTAADTPELPAATPIDSRTVITGEEIDKRQWRTLAEVLANQPGVHTRQRGGAGQRTELYFRGQRSGRVLLRLDGIELSDPLDDDAGLIVPELLMVGIDRIEIRRGPQGVSAGADATGGVIDVYTQRGSGPASPRALFEGGSFGTTLGSVGLSGGSSALGYQLSFSNYNTKGVTARRRDFGARERDDYQNSTVQARLDFEPTESLSVALSGRFIHSQLDTDPFGIGNPEGFLVSGIVPTDDLNQEDSRQLFLQTSATLRLFDERWIQRFSVGYTDHDRAGGLGTLSFGDPAGPPPSFVRFTGDGSDATRLKLAWENEIQWAPQHLLRIGAETERESVHSSSVDVQQQRFQSFFGGGGLFGSIDFPTVTFTSESRTSLHGSKRNFALFAQEEFAFERFAGELGVRLQDQDDFGSRLGYRAALSYLDPTTQIRLFASIATGSRDPDLRRAARTTLTASDSFQPLVGSTPGDDPLISVTIPGITSIEPEITRGIEVGANVPLPNGLGSLRVAYFRTRTRGITESFALLLAVPADGRFQPSLLPSTDDSIRTRAQGVEVSTRLDLASNLSLGLDYTYTSSEVRHAEFPVFPGTATTSLSDGLSFLTALGLDGGEDQIGIPKHLVAANVSYSPLPDLDLILSARYVGKRKDEAFGALSIAQTRGGFTTVGFALRYQVRDNLRVFGRVENAFDKEYHDPIEANGPERAGYVGVELAY